MMQKNKIKFLVMLLCLGIFLSGCSLSKKVAPISESASREVTQKQESESEKVPEQKKLPDAEAETKADPAALPVPFNSILKEQFQNFGGKCSYSLHLYGRGEVAAESSVQMKAASVIKLFIMDYAYHLMDQGTLTPETVIGGQKVSSLIESMITVSDNTATNILIDHFTMEKINAYIKDSGYMGTVLARRMLDTAAASRGEENYTTAEDVMAFLNKLYTNKDSYPQSEMLSVMKRQQVATKLRRDMPVGIEMASKTGELSDTENDVAIVFTPKGDYAIVCLTGGGSSQAAKNAMATACRKIYDALQAE